MSRRRSTTPSGSSSGPSADARARAREEDPLAFERVAKLDDIPADRGLCVQVRGIDVGLFRVGEDVHAMENRCPHAGAPLSEGFLDGCVITCPDHLWDFDVRTGFRPGHEDGFPIPCFAVRIEGDDVWIDLDEKLNLRR